MKKYLFRLLPLWVLLVSFAGLAHAQCRVSFRFADCRSPSNDPSLYRDTVLLYRYEEGVFTGQALPLTWNQTDTVTVPAPGEYHLIYPNLFGQQLEKPVRIDSSGPVVILVCDDSLATYGNEESMGTGRLASMSDGENLILQLERRGCFELRIEQIVISRQKGRYYARQYEMMWRTKKDKQTGGRKRLYKRGALLRETILTAKQMNDFLRFENELMQITLVGCTTSDHYTLTGATGMDIDRIDGSCGWFGYDFLEMSFFPAANER